jgi:hypothetical protein
MVVYVWTALLMMFYAANLPLTLVVDVDTAREQPLQVGVGVFVRPKKLHKPKNHSGKTHIPGIPRKTALRAIFYILRHMRFEGEARLCAGDAALTAILSGALMALTLGNVHVYPDFSDSPLRARFSGMVSIKPGHIMGVALVWARNEISGRINAWKSMRSRAL